jgi:hypothetical protein
MLTKPFLPSSCVRLAFTLFAASLAVRFLRVFDVTSVSAVSSSSVGVGSEGSRLFTARPEWRVETADAVDVAVGLGHGKTLRFFGMSPRMGPILETD